MPRIARMVIKGEPAGYHIISRTALEGFVIGEVEKEYLFELIKRLSSIYFSEVIGFCLMGNHFHLLVRMHPQEEYSTAEIKRRFKRIDGPNKNPKLSEEEIPLLRMKWASVSEYIRDIKQGFSRFYNRLHHRRGFFWSERFKSVIVDNGDALINCLAYLDLNPVRAGLVENPEEYRWSSLGYHVQTHNKDNFLSLDFGFEESGPGGICSAVLSERPGASMKSVKERLRFYRRFVHGNSLIGTKEKQVDKDLETGAIEKFKYRSRYFTDSGIIGSKPFINRHYQAFKHHFSSKHEKRPKTIRGVKGIYSLKRLSEKI